MRLRYLPVHEKCVRTRPESYHDCMRLVFFLASTAVAIAGEYTTYIGDIYPRNVSAITTDAAGNTYIVGNRGAAGEPMAVLIAGVIPITGFPGFTSAPGDVFVNHGTQAGRRKAASKRGVFIGSTATEPHRQLQLAGFRGRGHLVRGNLSNLPVRPNGATELGTFSSSGSSGRCGLRDTDNRARIAGRKGL